MAKIIGELGCKRLTKKQENELYKSIFSTKIKYYKIKGIRKTFNNLLEVYNYCKKECISLELEIYSNICSWGNVKALVTMSLKTVKENYNTKA